MLQTTTVTIPIELLVFLAGILVTVMTVFGGLIKHNYDQNQTHDQLLRGSNGDEGFVDETRKAHNDLARSQREIERTLRAHGALLQELVFTLHRVAEHMDEEEDIGDLDIRRLEHLEETLQERSMGESPPEYERGAEDGEVNPQSTD